MQCSCSSRVLKFILSESKWVRLWWKGIGKPLVFNILRLLFIQNVSPFLLVKTAHIIHHNQLLLTQYWINDVKTVARCKLLNRWRQKCSPLQIIEPLTEKTWGQGCVIFGEHKKQRAKDRKIFWMNNKAIFEFGFRRIWRILQVSEGVIHLGLRPLQLTPSLICRIFHILPFSSREAALLLSAPTWIAPSAHAQSQFWSCWLILVSIYRVYKAIQNRNVVGPGQRSRFLVLTKSSAAFGDENDIRKPNSIIAKYG